MIAFIAGAIAGIIVGIMIAPHVYLWHAEMQGIWPAKASPTYPEWEPIETDGYAGEPQGMEKAP